MEGVVEDPDRRVVEIPLLTGEEREGIVGDGTRRDGSIRGIGVSGSCSRRGEASAGGVGVVRRGGAGRTGSWGAVEGIRSAIDADGVGAETRVGLWVDRSFEMVVGMWGSCAGGAYVPLDPSYPLERLRWMAADAGVELVVGEEARGRGERSGDRCGVWAWGGVGRRRRR